MADILDYTPDADIEIHTENAIGLICAPFKSHENGIPEWMKNASDEYARVNADEERRVIILIINSVSGSRSGSIACLDLNGMTSSQIEQDFRVWASPDAAGSTTSTDVQGGHGNGGKCYMTQMFNDFALINTVKEGRRCAYGVRGGSIRFGYVPNVDDGRNIPVTNLEAELTSALAELGIQLSSLPEGVVSTLKETGGYTLIQGRGPKDYVNKVPTESLVESLRDNPQMVRTLDMCKVFVLNNGRPFKGAWPLMLQEVKPDPGFAEPRHFEIPTELLDPQTSEIVRTKMSGGDPHGEVTLRTSNVSMRSKRRGRHTVTYRASSGYIGRRPVSEFDVTSNFQDRIYGECSLMLLESVKQNERLLLANSPLTRAVEAFIASKIQDLALEFEARARRSYSQSERNGLSKLNEALDKWKNQYLKGLMQGLWGTGGTRNPPRPSTRLPDGSPSRIEIYLNRPRAGVGVPLQPGIDFFDRENRRVRAVPFEWVTGDPNIAMVDPTLQIVNTFSPGRTTLQARTLGDQLLSNTVELEVVKIRSITLQPSEFDLSVGARRSIEAQCHLSNGTTAADVALVWTTDQARIATVSTSGTVFGLSVGDTNVVAGDDRCMSEKPVVVNVMEGDGKGAGDKTGQGFPRVLVSGVDNDPDTRDSVTLSSDDPPVYQRPQDVERNIWWINSAAPLAQLYLDKSAGYGYKSREWRIYHVERYIEVMAQIALTSDPDQSSLSVNDWILRWGERVSEIQAGAASSLSGLISSGDIAEVN